MCVVQLSDQFCFIFIFIIIFCLHFFFCVVPLATKWLRYIYLCIMTTIGYTICKFSQIKRLEQDFSVDMHLYYLDGLYCGISWTPVIIDHNSCVVYIIVFHDPWLKIRKLLDPLNYSLKNYVLPYQNSHWIYKDDELLSMHSLHAKKKVIPILA